MAEAVSRWPWPAGFEWLSSSCPSQRVHKPCCSGSRSKKPRYPRLKCRSVFGSISQSPRRKKILTQRGTRLEPLGIDTVFKPYFLSSRVSAPSGLFRPGTQGKAGPSYPKTMGTDAKRHESPGFPLKPPRAMAGHWNLCRSRRPWPTRLTSIPMKNRRETLHDPLNILAHINMEAHSGPYVEGSSLVRCPSPLPC